MPAPSPYTPPQPFEPPNHPTPRISRARRLSSCSSEPSTSYSHQPSTSYSHQPSDSYSPQPSTSYSPQPSTSYYLLNNSYSPEPSTSYSIEPDTSYPQTSAVSPERTYRNPSVRRQIFSSTISAGSRSPTPSSADEAEEGDEDLKDPEHFIKAFSAVNGILLKFSSRFFKSLLQKLERYLYKVNLSPNHPLYMYARSKFAKGAAGNVDFVEAAFVVQGSSIIYGKKVDLLFDAAISLFRILSTPLEEIQDEEEGEEGEERSPNPKVRKGTKRPRLALENRDLAEEILAVDNFKEGKRIDHKKSVKRKFEELVKEVLKRPIGTIRLLPPNIPRLVRKTKALGTSPEEAQRINSKRVPQFGQGLEGRGFIDEYRLNEVVRESDLMLVDHVIPMARDPQPTEETAMAVEKVTAAAEEVTTAVEEPIASIDGTPVAISKISRQTPVNTCDSGIDSCPSSVYNPVENFSAQDFAWEGNTSTACAESDAVSLIDDGFISESAHEGAGSEMEEESELAVSIADKSIAESRIEVGENERSGTESSGIFSEAMPTDHESHSTEDERDGAATTIANETESAHEEAGSEMEEEGELAVSIADKSIAESGIEVSENERSENERSGTESSGIFSEAMPTDHESHTTEGERDGAATTIANETDPANETPTQSSSPALQEMDFTPTPRRNKRKMKSFKLPCKLSLLLPEKKKRRNNKAAALWRPNQSPCSSTSSNYPQSPMSYSAPSPDHHSLNLVLNDDGHLIPYDTLSDSDNEGEYFDPPSDQEPQVNHWIRNVQKDLLTAGQEPTLSDRVAQWQELIMPRLDANLQHGPYSHVKYAPILVELVLRKGWPAPRSLLPPQFNKSAEEVVNLCDLEDEFIFPLDWKKKCPEMREKVPLEESRLPMYIQYDTDFVEPRECDGEWGGESFFGFKSAKRMKRRGVELTVDPIGSEGHVRSLFSTMCRTYSWGLSEEERQLLRYEEEVERWQMDKVDWLQRRVGQGRPMRRNWDEWVEEDDNIEVNTDMDFSSMGIEAMCGSGSQSEAILFENVFSGFRKEEVSRLLFTALHLASQGHMEITSSPGEINSMKVALISSTRR